MEAACQLMLLAVIFDSIDGWIARKIKRRDDKGFGINVDSLSDIISFGLAPALFVYSTTSFRYINILVGILIMTCGILRLSRFNVIASAKKSTFIGLPIPAMAVVVSSLYLSGIFNAHHSHHSDYRVTYDDKFHRISKNQHEKWDHSSYTIDTYHIHRAKIENIRHGTFHPHHSLYISPIILKIKGRDKK